MEKNKPTHSGLCSLLLIYFALFFCCPVFAGDKIVTLNPVVAEWVAEILGEENALQRVVGVSEYSHYPEFMKKITAIGPYPQIQIEKILSLHPDLVIASTEYNRPDQLEKLKKLKLKVAILPREHFLKMDEWIIGLGEILGETDRAKRIALDWKKGISDIGSSRIKKKAFFEIQFEPLITVGKNSFLNDAFELAGFRNVFSDIPQSYPKVSREAVLEKNPEIIFVFEMVKKQEDLEKIRLAWKNKRVQVLNGDDFSRCSPRLLKALKGVK